MVEGAATPWPNTAWVAPARSTSQSSMQSPPASTEWITVMALCPTLARPGASPRSTWASNSSRRPKRWAKVAGTISPALATSRSSSKVTAMASRLPRYLHRKDAFWLGINVALATNILPGQRASLADISIPQENPISGSGLSQTRPRQADRIPPPTTSWWKLHQPHLRPLAEAGVRGSDRQAARCVRVVTPGRWEAGAYRTAKAGR